jgi:hypothetical protein
LNTLDKYRIVEKIIETSDENVLEDIKVILGIAETEDWATIPDSVKQVINNSLNEISAGKLTPSETFLAEIKSKYQLR